MKQQTLSGKVLTYLPSPSDFEPIEPPICRYCVVFRPATGGLTDETVFIQDDIREINGYETSPSERAIIAASIQTPYIIQEVTGVVEDKVTTRKFEASDEPRVTQHFTGD
ncbi:hypothetical protein [Halorussus salinus]|uniref:hypothetical protein n=1 Tax=Halorussus salinus TaxID=1364935 RepID=UPI001092B5BD|nr:hypothetical protein [Halorussus salinus]